MISVPEATQKYLSMHSNITEMCRRMRRYLAPKDYIGQGHILRYYIGIILICPIHRTHTHKLETEEWTLIVPDTELVIIMRRFIHKRWVFVQSCGLAGNSNSALFKCLVFVCLFKSYSTEDFCQ